MARKTGKPRSVPLTTSAIARKINRSENTTRQLLDRGVIPCRRDSGGRRIAEASDVDAYLESHKCA
ncbi:helix-turn-helix domain-containing protein [Povalibacter uvarum]|uniref:helix-turn-helix domain-containing protein n=1 Tax=Povalibacter uvarum TaxID=732238 RepID=UPI0016188725